MGEIMKRKIFSYIILVTIITAIFVAPAFSGGKGATPNGKPFVELQGQIIEVKGEASTPGDQIYSIGVSDNICKGIICVLLWFQAQLQLDKLNFQVAVPWAGIF